VSDIKVGEVAVIKTTDEPVFVLEKVSSYKEVYNQLSGTAYTVRRPVGSEKSGIQHVIEVFAAEELESEGARKARHKKEQLEIISQLSAARQGAGIDSGVDQQFALRVGDRN